jgi:hypothetical protein
MRRILEGSPNGANYSPDWIAATSSSPGGPGPKSLVVASILRRHAALWANDMREHAELGVGMDGKAAWLLHMREADAEINRYLAGPTFKAGAAA